MSAPAFAWALERGATLKLLAADRLVLIYLADMANGDRVCWPGQEKIVEFTGLALRTVRTSLRRLEQTQLIRAEARDGYITRYHILRPLTPANGTGETPANQHRVTPANGTGAPRQISPAPPGKSYAGPRQMVPRTPANGTPDPSITQERDPRARARAREAGKILSFGKKQEDAAPPSTPTATPGSDTFNSYLDAPAPIKALPCEVDQEVVRADVPDPDGPPLPGAFQALVASIACGFKNNYPPRATDLSRSEMIDLCQDKPSIKSAYLPDAVLRLQRKQAGIRHAADA